MPRPPAVPAPRSDGHAGLPVRFFRGLYRTWDLHHVDGVYVAVPKGTFLAAAASLAEVARQIAEHPAPLPVPSGSDLTAAGPTGGIR